jgi:hypothetical protein
MQALSLRKELEKGVFCDMDKQKKAAASMFKSQG